MNDIIKKLMLTCVNCGKTEEEIPLLELHYRGNVQHICPQCLPVLIHKPANLSDKLPGIEHAKPPMHEH